MYIYMYAHTYIYIDICDLYKHGYDDSVRKRASFSPLMGGVRIQTNCRLIHPNTKWNMENTKQLLGRWVNDAGDELDPMLLLLGLKGAPFSLFSILYFYFMISTFDFIYLCGYKHFCMCMYIYVYIWILTGRSCVF